MVVPSEILHVLHAESLRGFLTRECSRILIVDPTELWFGDTLQGVVLLMAEKKAFPSDTEENGGLAIVPVRNRSFLDHTPSDYFESADFISAQALEGRKWMAALLTNCERALLAETARANKVSRFADIAQVDVGIVTGANKFFLIPDAVIKNYRLSRWAHPMFGRSEHVPGVIYDRATHERNRRLGLPTNFLWFRAKEATALPRGAREYIALGESLGLHKRYKCRIRTPWYSVPSVHATPVGMLKRSHDFPRLVLNRMRALTTDTAYRVRPTKVKSLALVFSFVNSLTALCAELEGRHYGGGVLELVPSEIERLLIPCASPSQEALKALDAAFRTELAPGDLLERQDRIVLGGIGLPQATREILHSAWLRLRSRRQRLQAQAPVGDE
jgi:adenine-specific DNA methylase